MRQLLDYDPLTGTSEWFEDTPDGGFTITTTQDVTDTIEVVTAAKNALDGDRFGDMACVGYIPMSMFMALPADMRNGNDKKALRKWLIENSKLLVRKW